jgi:hypothetical protein
MDIRTGQTYETREDALAAGVPESDIAHVKWTRQGPQPSFTNPKYPARHQGSREMRRRLAKRPSATNEDAVAGTTE